MCQEDALAAFQDFKTDGSELYPDIKILQMPWKATYATFKIRMCFIAVVLDIHAFHIVSMKNDIFRYCEH